MRTTVLAFVLGCMCRPAFAGAYGKIGGDLGGPSPPADCSRQTPTADDFPDWSRLQWSVKLGGGWTFRPDSAARASTLAVVPQLSWQFWGREGQCTGGGGMFGTHSWRRLSLAWSFDVLWRANRDESMTEPSIDPMLEARPALRLARATYDQGFLSVGSAWVPSFEIAATVGPTFAPGFTGAALSLSATATIIALEVRVAAYAEGRGQEVLLMIGIADVHGLWKLGPRREYRYD